MARKSKKPKSKPVTDVTPRDATKRNTPSTSDPETSSGGSVMAVSTQRGYGGGVDMGVVGKSVMQASTQRGYGGGAEAGGGAVGRSIHGGGLDKGAVQSGGLDKGAVQSRSTSSGSIRPGVVGRMAAVEGSKLVANPDFRITLSDPGVRTQHAESQAKLTALLQKLDAAHGEDAEPRLGANTEQVPFSQAELRMLKSAVQAAIDLHNAPSLSPHLIDALKNIYESLRACLVKLTGLGVRATGTFQVLKWAVDALKEFLDALGDL